MTAPTAHSLRRKADKGLLHMPVHCRRSAAHAAIPPMDGREAENAGEMEDLILSPAKVWKSDGGSDEAEWGYEQSNANKAIAPGDAD